MSQTRIKAEQVSDLVEAVQDITAAALVAGTGVGISYNDTTGLITVTATGGGGGGPVRLEYNPTVDAPTGLVSWHRADNDTLTTSGTNPKRVTSWADRRGSGAAFTNGSGSGPDVNPAPMNRAAESVLTFVGHWMSSSILPATGNGARTTLLVLREAMYGGGNYEHLLHYGTAATGQAWGMLYRGHRWGNHYWTSDSTYYALNIRTGPTVVVARHDGSYEDWIINGMYLAKQARTVNTGSASGLHLGTRISPVAEQGHMHLSEVISWSRALSDAEVNVACDKLLSWYTVPA